MTKRTFLMTAGGTVLGAGLAPRALAAPDLVAVAGTGQKGRAGDGGAATAAQINDPFGLIQLADGSIIFCDTGNHRLCKVDAQGVLTTIAGTGARGLSGDGGPATAAAMNEPYEVRLGPDGALYVVERLNHCVRKIDAQGVISRVAGTGQTGYAGDGGPAVAAQFAEPHSIQFGPDGRLFICDIKNHRVRVVDMKSGTVSTLCGTGEKKTAQDGASLAGAALAGPRAVDFDAKGVLWLALREGNAVLKLDLKAGILRHVITRGLHGPKGLSLDAKGRCWLADTESHSVVWFDSHAAKPGLRTLVGTGQKGVLARPHGVFACSDGSVLIGDSENNRVWRAAGPR